MEWREVRKERMSENKTVAYGSSSDSLSVERRGGCNTRSACVSACDHRRYGSDAALTKGSLAGNAGELYSGLPDSTQAAQPIAPNSPTRGFSDSQNSSSSPSCSSNVLFAKDGGRWKVLSSIVIQELENVLISRSGSLQFRLGLENCYCPLCETWQVIRR